MKYQRERPVLKNKKHSIGPENLKKKTQNVSHNELMCQVFKVCNEGR